MGCARVTKTPPAFQFYWRDFSVDTAHMSDAAVGMYMRLLGRAWADRSIPADFEAINALLPGAPRRERERAWAVIAPCWTPHPTEAGRLIQKRLEIVRAEQDAYRAKQTAKSVKAVAAKKLRPAGTPAGDPRVDPRDTHGLTRGIPTRGGNPKFTSASADLPTVDLPASANLASLGNGGADEIDRSQRSAGMQFGEWFFGIGIEVGVIPAHFKLQPGPLGFAIAHRDSSDALVATYSRSELERRTRNLFARKKLAGEGRVHIEATPRLLSEHWDWFDSAEPPQRREAATAGASRGRTVLD